MERDYLEAALPEPVTLLGQRLQPFSVGHLTLLSRLDSPYLANRAAKLEDLILGILVCCQSFEEAAATLNDPALGKTVNKWLKSAGRFDFAVKSDEFERYLVNGAKSPDLHDLPGNSRQPGAPFLQRVRIVLQSKLGLNFSEAMNYPWGLALHDYFAFWELEGACNIFSAEDAQHLRDVNTVREEIQAEIAAAKASGAEVNWTLLTANSQALQ